MRLLALMRSTYYLGCGFAGLAIVIRGIQQFLPNVMRHIPVASRTVMFFSGLLFLWTATTGIYMQVVHPEEKAKAKGA